MLRFQEAFQGKICLFFLSLITDGAPSRSVPGLALSSGDTEKSQSCPREAQSFFRRPDCGLKTISDLGPKGGCRGTGEDHSCYRGGREARSLQKVTVVRSLKQRSRDCSS